MHRLKGTVSYEKIRQGKICKVSVWAASDNLYHVSRIESDGYGGKGGKIWQGASGSP